jgi:acylphosphatase
MRIMTGVRRKSHMRAIRAVVYGRVQGVGFRYMTKIMADKMGVTGVVWNASDGTVHVEAQAEEDVMLAFITGLEDSPSPYGKVTAVEVADIPIDDNRKIFKAI